MFYFPECLAYWYNSMIFYAFTPKKGFTRSFNVLTDGFNDDRPKFPDIIIEFVKLLLIIFV